MRWEDNSLGSTFDYAWGSINQAFSSGQVGMFTGGSDLYTAMVQNNGIKPDGLLRRDDPTRRHRRPASSAAAHSRRSTSSPTRPSATPRSSWIDFYYMQKLLTQDGAVADAEALKANNQPVGVPALPIFDKATYDAVAGHGSRTTSTSPLPR